MKKIFLTGQIEKSATKETAYRFLASTSSVDRQGDSIDQSGWELKNFFNNPVLLWAHRYDELPLGKIIDIQITPKGLEADVEFASEDANPKAQQVKKLVDYGILNAVSVGFIPKERNGNIITRAELLEISIVPVPANQDALALAYKDMDLTIKKDIEDVLSTATVEDEAEEKSGKVISKNTRKSLEISLDALKTSIVEIEKLLSLDNTDEPVLEDEKSVTVERTTLIRLQDRVKLSDKLNEEVITSIKDLLK